MDHRSLLKLFEGTVFGSRGNSADFQLGSTVARSTASVGMKRRRGSGLADRFVVFCNRPAALRADHISGSVFKLHQE